MSLITVFITPKGFDREHIAVIQWNAIRSWTMLKPDVDVVLIGDDAGVKEAAEELGVRYVKDVRRNAHGTPMLDDIFRIARETSDSPLLAYVNADIILFEDFVRMASCVYEREKAFMMVGQRWDMEINERIDFSDGWDGKLRESIKSSAKRHPQNGSDYFVFPRTILDDIPAFAIGRSGWDNWMLYKARAEGWKLINCTDAIDIIHQNHDYAHLPNGLIHHKQAESQENYDAMGNSLMIFTLKDCDYSLLPDGSIRKIPVKGAKLAREIEIFPLVRLHSETLSGVFYTVFHPVKSYKTWRKKNMNTAVGKAITFVMHPGSVLKGKQNDKNRPKSGKVC